MTNEEIVVQFQQIVETMQRIVNATGDLAGRVEQMEDRTAEQLGLLTGIQGNLRVLVEQFEKQEENDKELRARLAALEAAAGGSRTP